MQKASAVNTPRKPSTPATEPALKRRKTDHATTPDSSGPPTPASDSRLYADRSELRAATKAQAVAEALAAEKRAQQGFANNTIETQWVLDVSIPAAQNGTAEDEILEDEDEEDEWAESNGRQTYGSFKRKKKGTTSATATPTSSKKDPDAYLNGLLSSDDEGELDSDDIDSDTGAARRNKRKSNAVDDDAALDRVDLSKSSYAKSKKAGLPFTGARPGGKQGFGQGRPNRDHPRDRRNDKHPKNKKKNDKGRRK